MKRSERERELLIVIEDFWRRPWADIPEVRPALAKALVEAEIANGAKFDPEEPLPERLDLSGPGNCIFDPAVLDGNEVILVAAGSYNSVPGVAAAMKVAAEAVRRWNAWPELRKHAGFLVRSTPDGSNANDGARQLLALLDGKP